MELKAPLSSAAIGLAQALLIGLVIGAQRELAQDERQAGLRDFLLIALAGGVCALAGVEWLTAAALLGITLLLAVFHWQAEQRTGITTELCGIAVFCLAYLAASPGAPAASKLAVGAAIIVAAFLEAKRALHHLVRKTITETEFNDTIWFLAIIFVIYPLLPEGSYGPYDAFRPRQIWLFVILVSSISYVGYFLQRFLGARRGLTWTAIVGGLASTTAATMAFAHEERENPGDSASHWSAAVLANAIQFPRVLALVYVIEPNFGASLATVLLGMMAAGLAAGYIIHRRAGPGSTEQKVSAKNPFRLAPALKFGAVFAAVMFLSEAAASEFGERGLFWASAAGGTVDADAVTVSVATLFRDGTVNIETGSLALLLALFMNAVLKTALAAYGGGARFGWRVAAGFAVMFCAGAAILGLSRGF